MRPDLRLCVGSAAFTNWTRAEVESDILTPADGWSLEVCNPTRAQLDALVLGASTSLFVNGELAISGPLEAVERRQSAQGLTVALSGRDWTSPLVDCAPPSWSWQKLSLKAAAEKAIAELGVPLVVQAVTEATTPLSLVRVEPGETFWACLDRYARRLGLMIWTSSRDALLYLGRPDSSSTAVALLQHGGSGANVLSLTVSDRLQGRFSQITVLGQTKGADSFYGDGPAKLKGVALDPEITSYRPTVIDEGELSGSKAATARASWEVNRRRYEAVRLDAEVVGVGPKHGELWQPNTMVELHDPILGRSGSWWIAGTRLRVTAEAGVTTSLELRVPGLLAAEVA